MGGLGSRSDVQVTRDGVPIIYHDWRVHETEYDVPVHELTQELFQVRPLPKPVRTAFCCASG